jgi:hypothetical protein
MFRLAAGASLTYGVASAAWWTGCATDYSTLAGDASPGASADAAQALADGAVIDATASGDAASKPLDGGSKLDAGPACAPAASSFCATLMPPAEYCADFDTSCVDASIAFKEDAGSAVSFISTPNTAEALSAPGSLLTQVSSASLADYYGGAQWSFTVAAKQAPLSLDLDFFLPALPPDPTGDVGPFWLAGGPQDPDPAFLFYVSSMYCYFQIGSSTFSMKGVKMTVAAWHHVSAQIVPGPAATVTAAIDGKELWTNFAMPGGLPLGTRLTLYAGITTYQMTQTLTYVDNVVIRNK